MNTHPYDLVIGLDRSDQTADLCLIDCRCGQRRQISIATAPEALWEWLAELRQEHPEARVGLCLEQPANHLIGFLEAYAWITLHPINPITLQKYREAFVISRAKDDVKDAEFLADLLLTHQARLPVWAPEDSATRQMQQLVFHRRATVDERTALTNRLESLLKQYFPQALVLCGEDLWRPLATAFLRRWPSLEAVRKARRGTLVQFYHVHGSRSSRLLEERLALVEKAVAVTDESGVIESFTLRVEMLCRQLEALQRTLEEFDGKIEEAYRAHPDYEIFHSLPGAGAVLGPRLLASLGSNRDRYGDSAEGLQRYSGVAPVTKRSGGSCRVHRRYCCPKYHRQSFHEYASESVMWSVWAGAYYLQQRERGSTHHTAVRALAYKWQRIIWRCWKDRVPYDEARYLEALRQRGSGLVKLFGQVELGKSPWKTKQKKAKKTVDGLPQR